MKSMYKCLLALVMLGGIAQEMKGQVAVPFGPRLNSSYINIKGDYTFLANSILNRVDASNTANDPYNGTANNNGFHRDYIDIDGDPTTFSSSSSDLDVPFCSRIYWAGLYWSANYQQEVMNNTLISGLPQNDATRGDFTQIKFRVPGGSYVDLTADNNADPAGEEDAIIFDDVNFKDSPYVCFKNVTNLLQALPDPNGEYFVANVRATRGVSVGGAGGWTLVVIYENPTLSGKYISVFDGYAGVSNSGSATAEINVSGFNTIPVGPVEARIGASAVEGDRSISGDQFRIQTPSNPSYTALTDAMNPSNNYFNSNITLDGADVTTRNIFATNTLGYDADVFVINNPSNSVIGNDETDATLQLTTQGDGYGAFLVAFGIEIIEPNIVLEKRVENLGGTDITGSGVHLGQYLDYVLSFQNTGNDDATGYTIRDILPANVTLDELNLVMPTGVTYTYDAATREIVFSVPDNLVEQGDPVAIIRMRARVAENCYDFVNACDNQIENLAYSTYRGVINDNQISDDPSVSDFDACGFTTPGATNFLLDDLEDCDYTRTVLLCGEDLVLDAGNDFDTYIWVQDTNGNNVIDPSDNAMNDGDPDGDPSTLIVTEPGTYIVNKLIPDPCVDSEEIIVVELFGTTQINPITTLINDTGNTVDGEILICPNDGEELPQIFLCGLNDTELIQLNIPDADSIEWEKLDEGSCSDAAVGCANKNNTCTWNLLHTGNDFLADEEGEYRVIVNYQNGCFSRFYFNIFKNPLDPRHVAEDIVCTTPGSITITNVPADYEFSLLDSTTGNTLIGYQNSPSFSIATSGVYRVDMRQLGVGTGCVFTIDNIGILRRDISLDVTVEDATCTGLGTIDVSALGVDPSYDFILRQGATEIDRSGIVTDNRYVFADLAPGTYEIEVTTTDGCTASGSYTIQDYSDLALSALTLKNVDCTDAEVELTATGGLSVPGYNFAIWSYNGTSLYPSVGDIPAGDYQIGTTFTFDEAQVGDYVFVVVDGNNCHAFSNTVTVSEIPDVTYTTQVTNETCYGYEDGSFEIAILDGQGYSLDFTLVYPDYTTATNSSGLFNNLPSGGYQLVVTQTMGGVSCDFIVNFAVGGPASALSAGITLVQGLTCSQDAIIKATTPMGGTPPYEYSLDGVNFSSGLGSDVFGGLSAGTYEITLRDANLCTFTTSSITIDPLTPPTDLTFSESQMECPGLTSDLTATVVGGHAPFTFDIVSPTAVNPDSSGSDSATFNALSPGTYRIRVTDDLGCVYEENYTVSLIPVLDASISVQSHVSCFGASDGTIQIAVNDYQASYQYVATGPSLSTTQTGQNASIFVISGLESGSYEVILTDEDTQCTETVTATVSGPPSALDANITTIQPTCATAGRIEASSYGGWGFGYGYSLESPSGAVFNEPTGIFGGLNELGDYTLSLSDANGCIETRTITMVAPTPPVLALNPDLNCLSGGGSFELTATVTSGGTAPFEYRINGGAYQSGNVFAGLSAGTYTVEVRDALQCTTTAGFTMDPELALTVTHGNMNACGGPASASISANGGDGSYFYAILPQGTPPTPGDFGGISAFSLGSAGTYTAWVRDNSGGVGYCEASTDFVVGVDDPLALSLTPLDVNCNGLDSGTVTAGATGGQTPYEYRISGGSFSSNPIFNGLTAGTYSVEVRDANGCTTSEIAVIQEMDELIASVAVTAVAACDPGDLSEVRVSNIIGGRTPFEYSFDGGATYGPGAIAMLPAGDYSIYVRDANSCEYNTSITVIAPEPDPVLDISTSYECDGEGNVTVTNLDPAFDYVYSLDGTPNTPPDDPVFDNVGTGSHVITVEYTENRVLPVSQLFSENFGQGPNTPINEIDPVYCYEPQDGSPSLCGFGTDTHIQDGEYSVTSLIVNPYGPWVNPNDHSGLGVNGRFLAINVGGVAGVNGIMYQKTDVEVIPNQDITVSLWAFNLLNSTATQGDPSIEVELVNPSGTVIASVATGNVPKNTGPDDWHNYTVTLNPGANATLDIVIRTNAAFTSGNDIAIDDIQAYQRPVLCSETLDLPFTIEAGNELLGNITGTTSVSCFAGSDGSLSFEVLNFDTVNGFVYSVDGGPFSAVQTSSPVNVGGLSSGGHSIEVRDAVYPSCTFTLNANIGEPAPVVSTASVTIGATCSNGGATIQASGSGGMAPYAYQLEDLSGTVLAPYQASDTFVGVAPGDYHIRTQDINGCEDLTDAPVTVAPYNAIAFSATATVCYDGGNNATIDINVTNGNGSYQFQLNGGSWISPSPANAVNHSFAGLIPGNYTINVRDGFGCVGTPQNITINGQLLATVNAVDITSCADGTIAVNATGGDGSYVYAIVPDGASPSGLFSPANSLSISSGNDGDYDVYVRDQNGAPGYCEYRADVTVNPETPLSVTATPADPECYGGSGSLSINFVSGEAPFQIDLIDIDNGGAGNLSLNNIFGNGTIYNLLSGNYELTITDADGCTQVLNPVITDPVELTATLTGSTPDCTSGGQLQFSGYPLTYVGSLEFSANGGLTWQSADLITGLISGQTVEPSIRTVDGLGGEVCRTDFAPMIIPYPLDDLSLDFPAVSIVNCNELQVTVQGTNGTPDYLYTFSEDPANFDPITPAHPWVGPMSGAYTFPGLVPGRTYTFYVMDDVGCIRQNLVDVQNFYTSPLEVNSTFTPTCAGATTGSIDFTVTTNNPPAAGDLTWTLFAIDGTVVDSQVIPAWSSPATISIGSLGADTYYLEVQEDDGVNPVCTSASENVDIRELQPLAGTLSTIDPLRCNAPGRILVQNISGGGGNYQFIVTDPLAGTFTTTDNPIEIPVGSPAGNYTVEIVDQYGCSTLLGSVPVTQTPSPTLDSVDIDQCSSPADIQIHASSTIGAALRYSIDGGTTYFDNGGAFSGLSAGIYNLSIIDENGCTDTDLIEIHEPLQLLVTLDKELDCSLSPEAVIGIDIQAGSGSFEYEIRDSGGTLVMRSAVPGTSFTYSASSVETYFVAVWDVGTDPVCSVVQSVTVTPEVVPVFTANPINPSCEGASDGRIALSATDNGILPLGYALSPAAGSFNAATQSFEGLPAGVYTVEATGTNGCTTSLPGITLNDPAVLNVPAPTVTPFSCGSGNTPSPAQIQVDGVITGGTGTYVRYVFQDPGMAVVQDGASPDFTVIDPLGGVYTISVYDSNGCLGTTTANVPPYDELISLAASLIQPSCNPGNDGQITVNVTTTLSNPASLEFSVDGGASYQASNVFPGLGEGNYNIRVRHLDTGCEIGSTASLSTPQPDDIDIVQTAPIVCHGDNSAEITIELMDSQGYAGGVTYSIYDTQGTFTNLADDTLVASGADTGLGPITISNLSGRSYRIEMAQDAYPECSLTETFSIPAPTAPLNAALDVRPITCAGGDGEVRIYGAEGGWGTYSYYLGTMLPSGPGDYTAQQNYTGLVPGTYEVWILDGGGCETNLGPVTLTDPAPLVATVGVDADVCSSNSGQINVSASGGEGANYSYRLLRNGVSQGPPQSSSTFSGLGAGNYTVQVSDTWGCAVTTPVQILYDPMSEVITVTKPIDCQAPGGGEVEVAISGGSGNFSYQLTYPDGVTTAANNTGLFSGLDQAGTYGVQVDDLLALASHCSLNTSFVLDAPSAIAFDSPLLTDPFCNGGSNGSIRVSLAAPAPGINQDPIYQYALYDTLGTLLAGPQNEPLFEGLSAGTYEVEAISSRSCTARQTYALSEPAVLTASAIASEFSCFQPTSTITVTPSGGQGPYMFSLDDVNYYSSGVFLLPDTGGVQNLTVYVYDDAGCQATTSLTLQPRNTFSLSVLQTQAIHCSQPELVEVSLSDNGDPANTYAFELLTPSGTIAPLSLSSPTSAVFQLDSPGDYVFLARDTNTGCEEMSAPYTVAPYQTMEVTISEGQPVDCFGNANGELEVSLLNYNSTFDYELFFQDGTPVGMNGSASGSSLTLSGLNGGSYYLLVNQTDTPYCSAQSNTLRIYSPDRSVSAILTELQGVGCTNDLGEIRVEPDGGTPSYDIVINGSATGYANSATGVYEFTFDRLSADTYTVEVTDASGCVTTRTITLSIPPPITATLSATDTTLDCYGDTSGVLEIATVTGGEGNYQYQLWVYDATGTTVINQGGFQTDGRFEGLGAGSYAIYVADGLGCDFLTPRVTFTEPIEVFAQVLQTAAPTCTTDALVMVSASGGTSPYEYSIDGVNYLPMPPSNSVTISASPGDYQFHVRDTYTCQANLSNRVRVDPVPELTLDVDDSAGIVNCTGEATASLRASAGGGLGNYQFELFDDPGLTQRVDGPNTHGVFENLAIGTYYIQVTSGDCVVSSQPYTVRENPPLVADVAEAYNISCTGLQDGRIELDVSGGYGQIYYAISPNLDRFDTESEFTDLAAGSYQVVAQDQLGCFITFDFEILEPAPLDVQVGRVTPETCVSAIDGSVELVVTGGTPPYRTSFNSIDEADFVPNRLTWDNLPSGLHYFVVRDSQGCERTVTADIVPGINLNAELVTSYSCPGSIMQNRVNLLLEDPSVLPDLLFGIDHMDPGRMTLSTDFVNLAPGDHYLSIAHVNGCTVQIPFNIVGYDELSVSMDTTRMNHFAASISGGLPPYEVYLNDVPSTEYGDYEITETGNYTVRVIDANGCEAMATAFIEFYDLDIPDAFSPDGDVMGESWGPDNREAFPRILITIYDRYGRKLYVMYSDTEDWDGTYDNLPLPTGDYWYTIQINGQRDDRKFIGHFTLYR